MKVEGEAMVEPVMRDRFRKSGLVVVLLAGLHPGAGRAEDFPILGAKAMGMGGAGVASTRGGGATYWNPAALARTGFARLSASGESPAQDRGPNAGGPPGMAEGRGEGGPWSAGGAIGLVLAAPGDALRDLDVLHDDLEALNFSEIERKLDAGIPLTEAELQRALKVIATDVPSIDQPGKGLLLTSAAGPNFQLGRFGLSLLATLHAGSTGEADLAHLALGTQGIGAVLGPGQDRSGLLSASGQDLADQLAAGGAVSQNQAEELVFQAERGGVDTSDPSTQNVLRSIVDQTAANQGGSDENSISNNQSGARIRGLFLQELAVGYGHPLGDWLALGAAAKVLHAFTYSRTFTLRDPIESKEFRDDLVDLEDEEGSFNFGLDVGALFTPLDWLALGVTGKNLNRPSFDAPGSDDRFHLDPNARAGVAFFPLSWLSFAADLDFFHNHSEVLPGYRSQVLGGGAQFELGVLVLRAGLSKNLLDPNEAVLLHGGIGLRIGIFSLEASAMATPKLQVVNAGGDAEVPQRAGAALSLGLAVDF